MSTLESKLRARRERRADLSGANLTNAERSASTPRQGGKMKKRAIFVESSLSRGPFAQLYRSLLSAPVRLTPRWAFLVARELLRRWPADRWIVTPRQLTRGPTESLVECRAALDGRLQTIYVDWVHVPTRGGVYDA